MEEEEGGRRRKRRVEDEEVLAPVPLETLKDIGRSFFRKKHFDLLRFLDAVIQRQEQGIRKLSPTHLAAALQKLAVACLLSDEKEEEASHNPSASSSSSSSFSHLHRRQLQRRELAVSASTHDRRGGGGGRGGGYTRRRGHMTNKSSTTGSSSDSGFINTTTTGRTTDFLSTNISSYSYHNNNSTMVSHSERDISREAELLYRKVLAIRDQLKESEGGKGSSIYADALTGLSNALSKQGGERREEAVAIRQRSFEITRTKLESLKSREMSLATVCDRFAEDRISGNERCARFNKIQQNVIKARKLGATDLPWTCVNCLAQAKGPRCWNCKCLPRIYRKAGVRHEDK